MIKIAKAEEKHIPAIKELWLEFIKFHADADDTISPGEEFFQKGLASCAGFEKDFLRPNLTAENSLVLVAIDDEKTVGYAVAVITPTINATVKDTGNIDHVAVAAEYRRHEIGRLLYDEILKWFHTRGITVVQVMVLARNGIAGAFWHKLGYRDYQYNLIKKI